MTLDHVFVVCRAAEGQELSEGSKVAADRYANALVNSGFSEGTPNTHPGQGTANRRFFFERFMLEFLYVDDSAALNRVDSSLGLRERFCSVDASPFGIAFRPSEYQGQPARFSAVAYRPDYLPDELQINILENARATDPLIFQLPFLAPFPSSDSDTNADVHPNGAAQLDSFVLDHRIGALSAEVAELLAQNGICCQSSDADRLTLTFDSDAVGSDLIKLLI